jgi:diguanylate cyclase (GGDEF)-like protein
MLVAPLFAAAACLAAARALPPSAGRPWMLMSAGAVLAAVGSLLHLVAPSSAAHLLPAVALTTIPIAAGLVWTVHQRDRYRGAEIALDVFLVVGAVFVALIRWAPGVQQVIERDAASSFVASFDTIVGPLAAICAVAFAAVLLASLRSSRAGDSAAAIAGAAVLLAISTLPAALLISVAVAGPFRMAAIVGWGFVAYAGTRVVQGGSELFLPADADAGGARLRQGVAPVVALLVAVVVVSAGVGAPLTHTTAIVCGLLSTGIALRVSRLLEATRDRHSEQRQLAQSRALVEVSRALAGATHLDETLNRVADWSTRLLTARAAVIELLSDDGRTLEVRAAVGFPAEFIGLRFPVEGSFTGWVVRHGIARTTLDPAAEPDIQAKSRRFLPRCAVASAPLRYHDRMLGVLSGLADEPFDRHDLELLGALADQAAVAIENARLFEEVNRLSMTDPLTGLANRRRLEDELGREFSAALRGRQLVAVMFDLNEFKGYNDRYGHLAGDEALKLFGRALSAETRTMNLAARYGGDEFVTLLGDSSMEGARVFAQRVKRRFTRSIARLGRRPIGVAVGVSAFARGMTAPEHLIAAADAALYEMKSRKSRAS